MGKTACVIQGDIRHGIRYVLDEMGRQFDHTILSTWKSEEAKIPAGRFELILNAPPENPGITNRNLQRVSTVAGLECAESLDCEYVLKWRSDMLPTALDVGELRRAVSHKVPADVPSRIFMSAFRNLSILPDWFSSFPDLYAFGHIEMIGLLWSQHEFDFSMPLNVPSSMLDEEAIDLDADGRLRLDGQDVTDSYDAHVECYAWFKDALQKYLGRQIEHPEIARNYLYLADHERMKICWFRSDSRVKFRSIGQAWHIPWLTEGKWRRGEIPKPVSLWKYRTLQPDAFQKLYSTLLLHREMCRSRFWLYRFGKRFRDSRRVRAFPEGS